VGAPLALLIAMVVAMAVQLFNLRRVIGLPVVAFLSTTRAGLLAGLCVAAPTAAVVFLAGLSDWAEVALSAVAGGLCWGLLLVRERRTLTAMRRTADSGPAVAPSESES